MLLELKGYQGKEDANYRVQVEQNREMLWVLASNALKRLSLRSVTSLYSPTCGLVALVELAYHHMSNLKEISQAGIQQMRGQAFIPAES